MTDQLDTITSMFIAHCNGGGGGMFAHGWGNELLF